MYSNWALRSGWPEPSSAFRLTCREKPISMSSLRTLLGLIEWPMATSADASLSRLFDTHSSGRAGSPSVAGSTRRLRSSSSVASVSVNDRGPPPSRRTWPAASGGASRFSPRPMVLRASPVMLDTAARPPHLAARASLAANNRRPRSSRFEPSASQRCRIARQSIMQTLVAHSAEPRNRPPPSHNVAWPCTAGPLSIDLIILLTILYANLSFEQKYQHAHRLEAGRNWSRSRPFRQAWRQASGRPSESRIRRPIQGQQRAVAGVVDKELAPSAPQSCKLARDDGVLCLRPPFGSAFPEPQPRPWREYDAETARPQSEAIVDLVVFQWKANAVETDNIEKHA